MNENEAKRLVGTYSDMILRISFSYLKNTCDAEDICQTIFLKMLSQNLSFKSPGHEKAWVIRATVNACKDVLKSSFKKKYADIESAKELAAPAKPENELIDELLKLPRSYRISIYLYYYEGYTVREIAAILGKSENVVSSYLSRGRRKLRDILTYEVQYE